MDSKYKKMARVGFVAKGTVYAIIGVLTFMAAFNLGGQKAGQLKVLDFLEKQPFGNALLVLIALGLACYAAWRFISSISDPEGIGSDGKAIAKRIGFFVSGCIYLGLGVLAAWRAFGSGSSPGSGSGGQDAGQQAESSFLATDTGLFIIGAVGVAIIIVGIFQFVKAYKTDFTEKFDLRSMNEEKRRKTIINTAKFGLSSRGVIFLIIGYFALQAALSNDPSEIKTTKEAFSFLRDSPYGAWLMGIVAAGLVAYSIFMFMMAKYRRFKD